MEWLVGLAGLVVAFLAYRFGVGRTEDRDRKIAVEAEKHARDKAATDAADALKANERRFDRDMKRPADDVLTEAARRGGRRDP